MTFASRQDAGRQLAEFLIKHKITADLVLGLPRGGVVVAAEIASRMKLPLDVLVVRKIGHPMQREFAVGAIAEPDFVFLNDTTLREYPADEVDLNEVIVDEKLRLRNYVKKFHLGTRPPLAGKNLLIVDDGLATGATAEAAAYSARQQKSQRITIAVPVASATAVDKLRRAADAVEALTIDPDFRAVGQYYTEFTQTTDEEVISLLRENRGR